MKKPDTLMITGPVGQLETIIIPAQISPKGVAIICHPNPLQGGTNTNKVVQTIAKALSEEGFECYCPNLRGVGLSAGEHDYGKGEVDDVLAIIEYAKQSHQTEEVILAGFSFGGYVALFSAQKTVVSRLLLVAPAVGKYTIPAPDSFDVERTMLIQGEEDDVITLSMALEWARPQNLPVIVVPGAGHFFHGQLIKLKQLVSRYLLH
ncbi:alpha/beta hydrolase [Neisseria sp. Ec49-e6-T10]|uniref:alpha/beta hydrolase n=1 Tax=Neisseria sp. Ec49-e6-T10 TaxID=3140744 RepID=UPI003EB8534D